MSIAAGNLVVTTRHGQVRGRVTDGVGAFKGIPYAAPPFGPNRFQPPQPPQAWDGVLARVSAELARIAAGERDRIWPPSAGNRAA